MWTKRRSYTCVWQLEKLHVAVTLLFSCANIVKVLTKAKYLEQQVIRLIRVYTTCPRCSKTGRGNVLEGNVRPFSVNQAWLRAQWTLVAPQRISCPDANEISCVCIAHRRFHWTEFFTAEIYVYRVRFRVADKKQTCRTLSTKKPCKQKPVCRSANEDWQSTTYLYSRNQWTDSHLRNTRVSIFCNQNM